MPLDARWQLVHATHATPAEIDAVARSGAGVVLCPSTEANLGDGLADLPRWLAAGVPLAIGSDSQVTRAWREELRWLEYGQRLAAPPAQRGRRAGRGEPCDRGAPVRAARCAGGAAAAGFARWGLAVGRARRPAGARRAGRGLLGVPAERLLDALVFSSPGRPFRDVMVAGRWALRDHRPAGGADIAARFAAAMHTLWGGA